MNDGSGMFPDSQRFAYPADRRGRQLAVAGGGTALVPVGAADEGSGGTGFHINDIIRTILKWRWLITGVTLACVLGAIILSLLVTPIYQGSVTLEINREPIRITNSEDEAEPNRGNDADFIATQIGLLQSRALAERVARSLNLGSNEAFSGTGEGRRADRERAAVGKLQGNLSIEPVRGTRLINLRYHDPDPALAARIANAFADNFIESNLERRYEANSFARDFLQKRLATTKVALEKSERQAVDYASR